MASKWWRYNSTTHIFEQSLNEGDNWTVPPLNASIITEGAFARAVMPAGVAYRDIDNNFIAQTLATGSYIAGGNSYLNFLATSGAAGNKNWRIINYSDGPLRFERLNDAGTITGSSQFDLDGGITTGPIKCGYIISSSSIQTKNGNYIFPGRYDMGADGGVNGNWYLASHGSYGLFTNTGLYVSGAVWAAGGFVERGRAYAVGDWAHGDVNSYIYHGGFGGVYKFSYVGKTLTIVVQASANAGGPGAVGYYKLALPGGSVQVATTLFMPMACYIASTGGWEFGYAYLPNDGFFYVYRGKNVAWPNDSVYFCGAIIIPQQ